MNAEQSIGEMAIQLPGASAIFRRHKLDFCCGGQHSLRAAASAKGLDLDALLAELATLERAPHTASPTEPAALIDFILQRYHAVHREQLPELIRMATRVEAVHREHPEVPAGLAALLEQAQEELLEHMHKEESILFPMLKSGGNPFVRHPIGVMREEHTSHGEMLEQLALVSHNATPPQGACNTWRALYAGLAQLQEDLVQHIHLENNLLFPGFEAAPPSVQSSPCCGSCG